MLRLILLSSVLAAALVQCCSTVTLNHGGQIQGLSTTYDNHPVNLFLGVRYAQPPVGDLRFKKPQPLNPWNGIVNATTSGTFCTQDDIAGNMFGDEDCLFLDITVPGDIQAGANKPVMIYIHGGGFYSGGAASYIGGPLATEGDVIIVSLNYRLGIFGFLSDGPGTGNYGLWDQRAAIIWVKENIAQFGGDPELITIFGESAGGSSVSAHTVSPHNNGLFTRAIEQSGTLFVPGSWFLSRNARQEIVSSIRETTSCAATGKVFECFNGLSTQDVHTSYISLDPFNAVWHPVPDDDFFVEGFEEKPSYELSKRFDLLAGVNGQEGAIQVLFEVAAFAAGSNSSIDNGVSLDLARAYLRQICGSTITPQSANLCADFIIKTYRLDKTRSDRDRVVKISYFLGEYGYNCGTLDQLQQHAGGNRSTYAYYFTERYDFPENPLINYPSWLKRSASHLDELPFLFGSAFIKEESSPVWKEQLAIDFLMQIVLDESLNDYYQRFSRDMMKLWTNFAKTGNPNSPSRPLGYLQWPEFGEGQFMNLNRGYSRAINTPNEERLEAMKDVLLSARDTQVLADKGCF